MTQAKLQFIAFGDEQQHIYSAAQVYGTTWGRDVLEAFWQFSIYPRYPHFIGLLACLDGKPIACGMGAKSERGQWWHEHVARELGRNHAILQDAWVLIELAVLAPYRNQGIGRLLMNQMLERQPCAHALLSTPVDNHDARRFYMRHGWQTLHAGFSFYAGNPPFCVLHKPMPSARQAT